MAGLQQSVETAKALDLNILISQVGNEVPGVPRAEQHESLVEGLKTAADLLDHTGITLVIEPLNVLVDHAGYYLIRSDEAFQVVDAVGSPQVKVVFDIYHQQISEGHLIANITNNIDKIGHFHAAGNPGRHELQIGEINYPQIFDAIVQAGFNGYLGLEYFPQRDPVSGLQEVSGWF
jgi:hydroxypyruvate isomerase